MLDACHVPGAVLALGANGPVGAGRTAKKQVNYRKVRVYGKDKRMEGWDRKRRGRSRGTFSWGSGRSLKGGDAPELSLQGRGDETSGRKEVPRREQPVQRPRGSTAPGGNSRRPELSEEEKGGRARRGQGRSRTALWARGGPRITQRAVGAPEGCGRRRGGDLSGALADALCWLPCGGQAVGQASVCCALFYGCAEAFTY